MLSQISLALERIFSGLDLATRTRLIVAVSGGSDSLALLLLLKAYLDRAAPTVSPIAVTVDHALRSQSASEAASVAALCGRFAIAHRTVRWEGIKPLSGLPEAAREARHRLLADAAGQQGTDIVVTGHTCDDQAETVLMRKMRGNGRGLSGMAPATLYDGRVWFVRPLLSIARCDLQGWLRAAGISWSNDPTNQNTDFERARIRAELAATGPAGKRGQELLALARRKARERQALGRDAAAVIEAEGRCVAPGLFRLPGGPAGRQLSQERLYAARIVIACVGGASHLPALSRTAALLQSCLRNGRRATLSGALVSAEGGDIYMHREMRGGGPGAVALKDGMIWDRRFRILVREHCPDGLFVAPFGHRNAAAVPTGGRAPSGLVRGALSAAPALWRDGSCLGLLEARGRRHDNAAEPVASPWASYLPSFDLAPARAAAALLGSGKVIGPPPFAEPWEGAFH